MKKTIMALTAMFVCAGAVLADGNAFTPLDFNDTQYNAPATTYTQPIGISVPTNTSQSVLRCKLTLSNTGEATSFPVKATTSDTWSLNEDDDYYYYNGKAASGDSIDFCTQIEVPKELTNLDANKIYTITFQVEAIQYANGAASEVWTTAPSDWIESYGKGE